MKTSIKFIFIVPIAVSYFIFLSGCSNKKEIKITVSNPIGLSLTDVFVIANLDTSIGSFSLYDGGNEIPYQVLNSNKGKEIGFVVNMDSIETKTLLVKKVTDGSIPKFNSRTYAELSMKPGNVHYNGKFHSDIFVNVTKIKVPMIHTDHDALFRYEGPGWESEKIGYRFYLDWRNANDIFGKKVNKLLLSNVGIHDTVAQDDSYHSMLDWGMDIFKVGNSLGIGSIGMWNEGKVNMVSKTDSVFCEITENGPVRSSIKTSYFGWQVGDNKYDLVSTISITAGSRMSKCDIKISDSPENIATGLAKYEGTDFISNTGNGEWRYISLYGKQTLVDKDDELGIAVFYKKNNLIELAEDDLNYVVKLRPENGKVEYYFCAAWNQELDGIKNRNEFIKYLDNTLEQLNHPPFVKVD